MKILVLSDSHGCMEYMRRAVQKEQPDLICHLGDCALDAMQLRQEYFQIPFLSVPGNCDFPDSETPLVRITQEAGVKLFACGGAMSGDGAAALCRALEQVDFSRFMPPEHDPDVIPCASEKEARFITPDVDVGETIECTPDLMEEILEAEELCPQGALKIAILEEDDVAVFAENQYAIRDALCLWSDVPELLEQALRVYQGRAFWDGTGDLEPEFLAEITKKYGLVLL